VVAPVAAPVPAARPAADKLWPHAAGQVLGSNEHLLIYLPHAGDQLRSIAARFLGRESNDWMISEANGSARVEPDVPLIVPLKPLNPLGVTADRVQTVPILCYHRFGTGNSKMVMAPSRFATQLDWLARNGYNVIRLAELRDFLAGKRALPPKSVVITIDDGYESVHRLAFPVLKQYGFPATLFVYTDFVGAGDALRWPQIQEMAASGLVDIQSHTKTHRNLIERAAGETDERYRNNLVAEMQVPRDLIQRRIEGSHVRHVAYPYGDANALVTDAATRQGYELGLTVVPGGNPFYAQPLLLRRTMIFGDLDIEGFKAKLQVSRALVAP
jgi:peptidoglycan/xylan/chitin deacetylase (PgdA/CDA1 family)